MIFGKKMWDTCHVVLDCYGTPIPKFHSDLFLFHLGEGGGLRGPEQILLVTLKSREKKLFLPFLNVASETKFLP